MEYIYLFYFLGLMSFSLIVPTTMVTLPLTALLAYTKGIKLSFTKVYLRGFLLAWLTLMMLGFILHFVFNISTDYNYGVFAVPFILSLLCNYFCFIKYNPEPTNPNYRIYLKTFWSEEFKSPSLNDIKTEILALKNNENNNGRFRVVVSGLGKAELEVTNEMDLLWQYENSTEICVKVNSWLGVEELYSHLLKFKFAELTKILKNYSAQQSA